jgi:hypothetical protein
MGMLYEYLAWDDVELEGELTPEKLALIEERWRRYGSVTPLLAKVKANAKKPAAHISRPISATLGLVARA